MPTDPAAATRQHLEREQRSVFGAARLATGRRITDAEIVLLGGAGNLLTKALRRIEQGDAGAAAALVGRALRLRVDAGLAAEDPVEPGPMAAHVLLVNELAGLRAADPDGWLDRAIPLLDEVEPPIATALARGLLGLPDRELTTADRDRVLARLRNGITFGDPLIEVAGGEARIGVVLGVLRIVLLLRAPDPAPPSSDPVR